MWFGTNISQRPSFNLKMLERRPRRTTPWPTVSCHCLDRLENWRDCPGSRPRMIQQVCVEGFVIFHINSNIYIYFLFAFLLEQNTNSLLQVIVAKTILFPQSWNNDFVAPSFSFYDFVASVGSARPSIFFHTLSKSGIFHCHASSLVLLFMADHLVFYKMHFQLLKILSKVAQVPRG